MSKKLTTVFAVLIIIAFIGYMIFDSVRPAEKALPSGSESSEKAPEEMWKIEKSATIDGGTLKAVAAGSEGLIYAGGSTGVKCLDKSFKVLWSADLPYPVTALAAYGDTIIAATTDFVMVLDGNGKILEEWGPYEDKSIITSVAFNGKYTAIADAVNKIIFIVDKKGAVVSMMGHNSNEFIVPSPYFDVALDAGNRLFVANTGHRRIETRSISGDLITYFGEAGMAPEAFCGCCNPSHFTLIPGGFVTSEKGINRIKLMTEEGKLWEFVSSADRFLASIPLDLASHDGTSIYAANPADSKLYEFVRK